jgi:hypothetical protein
MHILEGDLTNNLVNNQVDDIKFHKMETSQYFVFLLPLEVHIVTSDHKNINHNVQDFTFEMVPSSF